MSGQGALFRGTMRKPLIDLLLISLVHPFVVCECASVDPVAYLHSQAKEPGLDVHKAWERHTHLSNYEEIRNAAADTFEYLPKRFDERYKNPCWMQDGSFKCMPYFQILGVSKCGTTDLYHRLTFHPEFVDCGWKGPHFWDEAVYPTTGKKRGNSQYDGSFQAYVDVFKTAADRIQGHPTHITGEASSNTFTGVLTYLRGYVRTKGINATLAQYMWEAAPFSRFIVLFRDPVDRYYSAYYYYSPPPKFPLHGHIPVFGCPVNRTRKSGPGTPEDFHSKAVQDIKQWSLCIEKQGEHECLKSYMPQQLIKGMYAAFIPTWLEVWPREHFLFIRNEDYQAAPLPHVQAAIQFLGMQNVTDSSLEEVVKMKKRNKKQYDGMLPKTRELLRDFYRPFNERLVKLMDNDSRWLWGY